ncbi:MAG TPA: hypothetical protein VKF32_04395, partial [Thermoanaerobaculia bacterium]|nr:hypothetical protein [Thermoanaerobaculia bacterium]
MGAQPGETKQVRVQYEAKPANEGEPPEKPEEIDYTIAVKAIKKKALPALDDDFAKDLGDFGSLAELREDVRKKLLAADERKLDRELKSALVDSLVEKSQLE